MLEKQKKSLLLILGITLVWIIGSTYIYTCVFKGFCQSNQEIVKQESVQEEIIEYEDNILSNVEEEYNEVNTLKLNNNIQKEEILKTSEIKNFERRTIKCYTHINSVIKLNSNQNIVSEVQKLENFFNDYYKQELTVDGIYGEEERQSVMNFQKTKNLDVDGVVGPKTLEIINAVYCVKNEKNN